MISRHYKKYLLLRGMFVISCIYQLIIGLFLLRLPATQNYMYCQNVRDVQDARSIFFFTFLFCLVFLLGAIKTVLLDTFLLVQIFFRSVNI